MAEVSLGLRFLSLPSLRNVLYLLLIYLARLLVCCLLFAVCCPLSAVRCLPSTVRCPLPLLRSLSAVPVTLRTPAVTLPNFEFRLLLSLVQGLADHSNPILCQCLS